MLRAVDLFSTRAELFVIHEEPPWADLLAGMDPAAILARDKVQLVDYCRAKGLGLVFVADPTDGLSRAQEAPTLRRLGRSLTDPAVQALLRAYVRSVASVLRPQWLGLAVETNLVRAAAPATLYQAVRTVAAAAAADVAGSLAADGSPIVPFVSVQVEMAWGRLAGAGAFAGVAQDRADFPFAQALGLSSYPYFAYATPQDIPADHYSRVLASYGAAVPAFVSEGGWPSTGVSADGVDIVSSAALQAGYIARHAALLDGIDAFACVQLPFTDLDLSQFPSPQPANLPLFASLGLVDANFAAKPALAEWDALHARPWRAGALGSRRGNRR